MTMTSASAGTAIAAARLLWAPRGRSCRTVTVCREGLSTLSPWPFLDGESADALGLTRVTRLALFRPLPAPASPAAAWRIGPLAMVGMPGRLSHERPHVCTAALASASP